MAKAYQVHRYLTDPCPNAPTAKQKVGNWTHLLKAQRPSSCSDNPPFAVTAFRLSRLCNISIKIWEVLPMLLSPRSSNNNINSSLIEMENLN
jgi:hypothetical protein